MKRILLTGSNGFIGSYFKNKYKDKYLINSFSFRSNTFADLDLSGIDTVLHLSALVHQSKARREEYEKVNLVQTIDLAKKSKYEGVKHFIFMSTVKVYGEETDIVYTENSNCEPQDDYGKSKLEAEKKLKHLEDSYLKVSIVRTPIVYGYGVKANIKNLITLVEKIPIIPFANINNTRSMIYVGNLCHLADKVIIQERSGLFLANDDKSLSTTKLIELIAQNLNKKVYLLTIPFFEKFLKLVKPSFHKRLYKSLEVDNRTTKEVLNLANPYSVEEGIRFMITGER